MSASSRALGALTLAAAVLLPALPALALPGEDPSPAASAGAPALTLSGKPATPVIKATGDVPAPPVAADSWVVADLDSGAVLASQNADLQVRPASTLKLLTVLTVTQRLAQDRTYRGVVEDETAEGSRVVLYKGLDYTVADLMHAALLPSANDAAEALARANGGVQATVDQMNAEAARLGAARTTARNPSGLDADGQVTTAQDMAVIGRAALANPEISAALKRSEWSFPGKMENGKRVIYPIYNHNRTQANDRFPGYLGGKSGFTSQAGKTLVAAADRDGRRLIVTLFHIGGNTYRTGEALLTWAYANAAKLAPVGQLASPGAPAAQPAPAAAPATQEDAAKAPAQGAAKATGEQKPESGKTGTSATSDAPTATAGASGWNLPGPELSMPALPSPLTVLTWLMGLVVLLRARVYWIAHRKRTAWVSLSDWAAAQARSAHGRAPADRPLGPGTAEAPRSTGTEPLVGTRA